MRTPINEASLSILFRDARSHNGWLNEPINDDKLQAIAELAVSGPTSVNCQPMRLFFLKSDEAKQRLKPALQDSNVDKSMTAPVVAIVAHDLKFWEKSNALFPAYDISKWYENDPEAAAEAAFRNSSLQGAYLILAARALGLDCGPMSGFDADKVNAEFFPDGQCQVNFLLALGIGDPEKLHPKNDRLDYADFTEVL